MFHSAEWDHDHDLTRRARRGHRHGRLGDPVRPADRRPGRPDARLPAHARRGSCPTPTARRRASSAACTRRCRSLQKAVRSGVYWSRESFLLGFIKRPALMRGAEKHRRRAPAPARSATPSCGASSTPHFRLGCKRVLISNDWYPALTQPNVELVTDAHRRRSAATRSCSPTAAQREVDTIILGTGFHVTDPPTAQLVRGRDGGTLAERMPGRHPGLPRHDDERAARTTSSSSARTPASGHNSMVYMIESQLRLRHGRDARHGRAAASPTFEVRPEARARPTTRRSRPRCRAPSGCRAARAGTSTPTGRNTTLWPDFTWRFRHRTRRFDTRGLRAARRRRRAGAPMAVA